MAADIDRRSALDIENADFHLARMQDLLAKQFGYMTVCSEDAAIATAYANVVTARINLIRFAEGA